MSSKMYELQLERPKIFRLGELENAIDVPGNIVVLIFGTAFALLALQAWRTWWRLRHIPGPPIASLTNFQRMGWVLSRKAHLKLQEQHDRYGELVRIGPNTVSFSNAEVIPSVYVMRPGFPKVSRKAAIGAIISRCGCVFANSSQFDADHVLRNTGSLLQDSGALYESWGKRARRLQHAE